MSCSTELLNLREEDHLQIVLELKWIVGHPVGVRELLGVTGKKKKKNPSKSQRKIQSNKLFQSNLNVS